MKKALSFFGDLRLSVILFLLFAFFSALATFIESSYDTATAWAMVYDASYFSFIQFLLGINVLVGIYKYKMISEKKLPSLIFHLAFIFILVGAALTRYGGFEGSMHIREAKSSNSVQTDKSYIWAGAIDEGKIYHNEMYKYISKLAFLNDFSFKLNFGKELKEKAEISYEKYLLDAKDVFVEDEKSPPLLSLMLSKPGERGQELLLRKGEIYKIEGVHVGFMSKDLYSPYVDIDKDLNLSSDMDLKFMSMSDGKSLVLKAKTKAPASLERLYTINDFTLAIKYASLHARPDLKGKQLEENNHFASWFKRSFLESMRIALISSFGDPDEWSGILKPLRGFGKSKEYTNPLLSQNALNVLKLRIKYKDKEESVYLLEGAKPAKIELAGQSFFLRWGPNKKELPFSLKLKDFELLRYAGSNSPSSYASYVVVEDANESFDYKIYMNHVLDYKGYRFYQSSYDQDEEGTILSVNKDPGKLLTYIGYTLLLGGMFFNLLNPYSRFQKLAKLINQDAMKNTMAIILFAFLFFTPCLKAKDLHIDDKHIDELSSLVVQKMSGRMVPFNTLATEILEKVHSSDTYEGLRSEAVFLLMMLDFEGWSLKPLIKLSGSSSVKDKINELLGTKNAKYLTFMDFFTKDGSYKLTRYIENANRKAPSSRGVLDKALLKLDERVNILNLVFSGDLLRIIPKQNDEKNAWLGPVKAMMSLKGEEKKEVDALLHTYFNSLSHAINTNDYEKANMALLKIKAYQHKYGSSVMIAEGKIKAEIFANKHQVFVPLAPVYLLAGFFLLILVFIKMLAPKIKIDLYVKISYIFNILIFLILSAGMGLRWYIASRPPWSNSYESMLFIAWSLSLSGIFFAKKSPISLSLTSMLAGIVLGVAHLSQLDPQITNLVPVLQSYWLTIHVSVITASYGFLGLSMLLGAFVLILFILLKKDGKNNEIIMRNITEASRINEMSLILGISLLVAGNFLGAIWANESWGRYWSWDSKEVWTLITILIYAAILHIRLVPSLSKQYTFALCTMFAYWSVLMTYFGVNYFLVGMHSYAGGEPVNIPSIIYYIFFAMIALSILSYFKRAYSQRL